jgi:hypothetical protein
MSMSYPLYLYLHPLTIIFASRRHLHNLIGPCLPCIIPGTSLMKPSGPRFCSQWLTSVLPLQIPLQSSSPDPCPPHGSPRSWPPAWLLRTPAQRSTGWFPGWPAHTPGLPWPSRAPGASLVPAGLAAPAALERTAGETPCGKGGRVSLITTFHYNCLGFCRLVFSRERYQYIVVDTLKDGRKM